MAICKRIRGWMPPLYDHPYNRQRPAAALSRLMRWYALRIGGGAREFRFWGTRTIRCYPDADGSMWLILNEIMDWDEFHFMGKFLRPDDTLLDIGANLGIYALWASQFIDTESGAGRIVAFEPDPTNLSRLHEQIALNDLHGIEIAPIALSASTGTIRFSQGQDGNNHIMTDGAGQGSIDVTTTTLDAYCAEHGVERVNFAKIDVEGAEQFVLAGARQLLTEQKVDVIQLEFNEEVLLRGLDENEVPTLLRAHGYDLYRFDPSTVELINIPRIDFDRHQNLFAIHDIAAVRRRIAG